MSPHLTVHAGGRDEQPHAAHTLSPVRRRFAADLDAAYAPLSRALAAGRIRDAGGHVHNLHPTPLEQAEAAGHPSALPPYDHATDPDRPVLPSLVMLALNLLGQYVRVPGSIDRPAALEALDVVARWARPDLLDDCNPHGLLRPGGAS